MRTVHFAAAAHNPRARTYISLDHFWARAFDPQKPGRYVGGRALMRALARRAKAGGDFPWHIAHHPYPESLFDPAFWKDGSAVGERGRATRDVQNLRVLGEALRSPELQYRGKSRRVILSEQGFHRARGTRRGNPPGGGLCSRLESHRRPAFS